MGRFIVIGAFVLFVLLVSTGVMLYLAYGLTPGAPDRMNVPRLSDSAEVELFADGSARIMAANEEDAYAALGALHAQRHGWTMALYRRTAIGRLSEWFGDELLEVDRLTLRLVLGRGAREAFGSLPDDRKRILRAYARGVNAAWERRRSSMRDEFVLLGVQPDPWEPWHALAVERLYAWSAAPRPPADTLSEAGGEVAAFFEADRLLQRLIHLHGFDHSLAWTRQDSTGVGLFQRHVYGASALPLFQSVVLDWPGADPVTGATLVGTPFMPVGKDEARAWSILLSSPLSLERAVRDTAEVSPTYERLISADGEEHLLRVERTGTEIFFEAPQPFFVAADTLAAGQRHGWILRWSGLTTPTDAEAWSSLATGAAPAFQLFGGDGIVLSRDGSASVLGQPVVSIEMPEGSLISNNRWAAPVADRLATLLADPRSDPDPSRLRDDLTSSWAAGLAPQMTRDAIAVPNQPGMVTEALAFMRNWDFAYDRASIAASIFETWVSAYRDSLGRMPTPTVADTVISEILVRYELLVNAVEEMSARHGDNLSQWRWEVVQPKTFHFPVFSADTLLRLDAGPVAGTRYASIELPGAGHPSTLLWGPSFVDDRPPSPAVWEAWISTTNWEALRVRSRRFEASRFFGRYLVSDRNPESTVVAAPNRVDHTLTLLP